MTENKFNTYLTYLMLDAAAFGNNSEYWWLKNVNLREIESANHVKITDGSIYGKKYVTIELAGNGKYIVRKRRK